MKFEDLEVWQRAVRLSADLYRGLRRLPDWGFRDQVTRAGLSIPSNIAEGFERGSAKDCLRFLAYAKGSCGELRTQLRIGLEAGYLDEHKARAWLREAEELSRMIHGLMQARRRFLAP